MRTFTNQLPANQLALLMACENPLEFGELIETLHAAGRAGILVTLDEIQEGRFYRWAVIVREDPERGGDCLGIANTAHEIARLLRAFLSGMATMRARARAASFSAAEAL